MSHAPNPSCCSHSKLLCPKCQVLQNESELEWDRHNTIENSLRKLTDNSSKETASKPTRNISGDDEWDRFDTIPVLNFFSDDPSDSLQESETGVSNEEVEWDRHHTIASLN